MYHIVAMKYLRHSQLNLNFPTQTYEETEQTTPAAYPVIEEVVGLTETVHSLL